MNAAALALPTSRQIVAIDAALLRGRDWRIALPGSLEGEYRQAIAEHRHQQLLRTGWLALVIFNSFLLVDLLIFFRAIMVGFAYLWRRGDLDWVRAVPKK